MSSEEKNLCPVYSLSLLAQIGIKFGCVPLAPIYVYKGEHKFWQSVPDVLTAHRLIRNTGIPNFFGLRIPVNINLNVSTWRKHLASGSCG